MAASDMSTEMRAVGIDRGGSPPAGSASFGIRVRHAQLHWYLSWLLDADHAMLNPDPAAAMRFGSVEGAKHLIENTAVLSDLAQHSDADVVPLFRPYRGVRLLDCRRETRCCRCEG
jgi:hypothetical protein